MKDLIVITSCLRDKQKGYHEAIRETWGKDCPIDYRFILGRGNEVDFSDELVFDIPDDYAHVTYKTKAGHFWASTNQYGYVFQAFTDSYLNIPTMLDSGFEAHDYSGFFRGSKGEADFSQCDPKGRYAYASGGVGYWTSPRATKILAESDIELDSDVALVSWAEDLWTGTALGKQGVYGHHDSRYILEGNWVLDRLRANIPVEILSLHMGRGTGVYNPQWMYDAHDTIRKYQERMELGK